MSKYIALVAAHVLVCSTTSAQFLFDVATGSLPGLESEEAAVTRTSVGTDPVFTDRDALRRGDFPFDSPFDVGISSSVGTSLLVPNTNFSGASSQFSYTFDGSGLGGSGDADGSLFTLDSALALQNSPSILDPDDFFSGVQRPVSASAVGAGAVVLIGDGGGFRVRVEQTLASSSNATLTGTLSLDVISIAGNETFTLDLSDGAISFDQTFFAGNLGPFLGGGWVRFEYSALASLTDYDPMLAESLEQSLSLTVEYIPTPSSGAALALAGLLAARRRRR